MYKRKNSETRLVGENFGATLIVVGLLALITFSVGGTWLWATTPKGNVMPTTLNLNTYNTPYPLHPTQVPALSVKIDTFPTQRLVIGATDGGIMTDDGSALLPMNVQGSDPSLAADGKTLAYVRDHQLYLYQNGKEQLIKVPGNGVLPSWNADGSALWFVSRQSSGDTIYRLRLKDMQLFSLLTVPQLVAPPLSNPATGRILIVEKLDGPKTAFYTIDPLCATPGMCFATRKDIGTVDHEVSWADYDPNATQIVFSSRTDGNIYLLATATGKVTPLVTDTIYKRHPVFSIDGKWLAYLSQADQLYLLRLDNSSENNVPIPWIYNVLSVQWAAKVR